MTGLALGINMTLFCEGCGTDYECLGNDSLVCPDCGREIDEEIQGEIDVIGALHYIGLNPRDVRGIRYTQSNAKEYEPRLIFTMKNDETLTLCKVIKEEHLQPKVI